MESKECFYLIEVLVRFKFIPQFKKETGNPLTIMMLHECQVLSNFQFRILHYLWPDISNQIRDTS